jgi:hypothetical protein
MRGVRYAAIGDHQLRTAAPSLIYALFLVARASSMWARPLTEARHGGCRRIHRVEVGLILDPGCLGPIEQTERGGLLGPICYGFSCGCLNSLNENTHAGGKVVLTFQCPIS